MMNRTGPIYQHRAKISLESRLSENAVNDIILLRFGRWIR
jgi:hypothetical protein